MKAIHSLVSCIIVLIHFAAKTKSGAAPTQNIKSQTLATPNLRPSTKCIQTLKIYGECMTKTKFKALKWCVESCPTNLTAHKIFKSCNSGGTKNRMELIGFRQTSPKKQPSRKSKTDSNNITTSDQELNRSMHENSSTKAKNNSNEICFLEKEVGLCRALIPRFFYDYSSSECKFFNYGGCGGNANNFETFEECQLTCDLNLKAKEKDICALKKDSGPCSVFTVMYYYNSKRKICDKFVFGGCGGNENRFHSIEECIESCISKSAALVAGD